MVFLLTWTTWCAPSIVQGFKSELDSLEPAERIQPLITDKNSRMHQLRDQMGLLQNRQQNVSDSKEQKVTEAKREYCSSHHSPYLPWLAMYLTISHERAILERD